jgi:hypothetical protein
VPSAQSALLLGAALTNNNLVKAECCANMHKDVLPVDLIPRE